MMCCLFMSAMVLAQTRMDRPLVLADGPEVQRQMTGVQASNAPQDILATSMEQQGAIRFSTGISTNTWDITLPSLNEPAAGTQLVVITPEMGPDAITLVVNGAQALPLEWAPGELVLGSAIDAGVPLSVVHTGNAYQVLNGAELRIKDCPTGMAAVNTQYCIDLNENVASDFVQAAITCASAGKRLCYWGEFHSACVVSAALGITGMTNNWEWTNNTSNEDNSVRRVGYGSCTNAGNGLMTGSATFHCCYTR